MIGNDVVDLNLAGIQSNWQRKGYLNKIFTEFEQQLIAESADKNITVWQLWSRKEAVYKVVLQQGCAGGYYPKKIECLDVKIKAGIVQFNNKKYFTSTYLSGSCIHSIAVLNKVDLDYVIALDWNINCVTFNNIPYLFKNNKLVNISKSHHGQFEKIVALNV
ncbi:MAG: 4-phosphopantetheinyl transferase family protein [Flavobacterium sp.]|nr:4-phosphopantetheinyl transferase family protein [Flavobacterium sp.]